ncbi:type II toxin-antitoxin system RelE/ParE family toxin [Xylella fastidiosa]|uniref:type II toxin-antitoxin system RelE/ParE family toxin n=1 Tax=Xylella fastidiosa TaxID=2371 RepID=UPI00073380A7|nr:type II toxin-antitoxin system RelE/ParE family toxin [Xylella fastidiosa]TNW23414.1 type II toxin-antitoxin system RelE/ParE family toxin [Xylella fastidiosa subsp. pauca]
MAKPYRLTPLAEADLEEIWFYTFRHWSIGQADSYHRSLVAVFEELAAGTKQGRPSVLPDFNKYLCGSHVVYFMDYPDHLDVIRILHQRQDTERYL